MVIKVRGILDFTPVDFTKKHKSQSVWKELQSLKPIVNLIDYAWF
jgi:hypothetical protein